MSLYWGGCNAYFTKHTPVRNTDKRSPLVPLQSQRYQPGSTDRSNV
ncbi:hypothetical protein [Anabaena azotica]|uniref:Uncharacterized protein n=1 Tax=Anabaena azotica FACHB-119 TaxID=947527 RepID=A0ABR8DCN3_9NOST|nr:hypothetical protein [Anabaena azotica]MBD2504326.1 hypothetical protein [Anabaena azotica FACHB-119]